MTEYLANSELLTNMCFSHLMFLGSGDYIKKSARHSSVHVVKEEKMYDHIPTVQALILSKRIAADAGLPQQRPLCPEVPRTLGLTPAVPPPPMKELLRTQVKRGLDK